MSDPPGEVLVFDGFEVDLPARELRQAGERIHVEPQVFGVLAHLVVNRDRLVTREELLDSVWGDQFVSISALTTRIKAVRRALGDDGRQQRYIRTEWGRGYRFVADVRAAEPVTGPARVGTAAARVPDIRSGDSTIGRTEEVERVGDLVVANELVTVVGPGGVGKTRLVMELARTWDPGPKGELAFVALDSVRDHDEVEAAVATALGLDGEPGSSLASVIGEWLMVTQRLLVLDNCEHVSQAVRALVRALREHPGETRVLATSREPLQLRHECVFRLEPLAVTVGSSGSDLAPALELFVRRARQADPAFELDDRRREQAAELCRRLDGLPLALELAASRIVSLGLTDLVEAATSRVDVLRDRRVGEDGSRQQSLMSAVDWSFALLEPSARLLLLAICRFPAGVASQDLEGVAERLGIAQPADEVVSQLVDASLVVVTRVSYGVRYRALETIRLCAAEKVADAGLRETLDRLVVDHAVAIARRERSYWAPDTDQAGRSLFALRDEMPNFRDAREQMLRSGDVELLVEMLVGLDAFAEEACLAELWSWHEGVRELCADGSARLRAMADVLEAQAARNRGDFDRAIQLGRSAMAQDPDDWTAFRALHAWAMPVMFKGDPVTAGELWIRGDAHLGIPRGRMFAGMCAAYVGDLDAAFEHLAAAAPEITDRVPVEIRVNHHFVAAEIARVADTGTALASSERAVEMGRDAGVGFSLGVSQVTRVSLLAASGDTRVTAQGYVELIELWLASATWPQIWTTLRNAADLLDGEAPEVALLIREAAARDRQAPVLDDAARQHEAERRAENVAELGRDAATRVSRRAAMQSRGEIAEEALRILRELASQR